MQRRAKLLCSSRTHLLCSGMLRTYLLCSGRLRANLLCSGCLRFSLRTNLLCSGLLRQRLWRMLRQWLWLRKLLLQNA